MEIEIRESTESDHDALSDLVLTAFGDTEGREIADLVDHLIKDPTARPALSLIAERDKKVVGQILFSKVWITDAPQTIEAAILAPLCVHPSYQHQGIGGLLIQEGLRRLRAGGVALVFVLGHPGYYPRYGFEPAGARGLQAPHPITPENASAWMVQALVPDTLGRIAGTVRCAGSLDDRRYWTE